MWFHGWTFDGHHNFAEALWGRGNCWITMAIPEFLDMVECPTAVRRILEESERAQVNALMRFQDESGMWHTFSRRSDLLCRGECNMRFRIRYLACS